MTQCRYINVMQSEETYSKSLAKMAGFSIGNACARSLIQHNRSVKKEKKHIMHSNRLQLISSIEHMTPDL
jgi:hypothetical protein